MGKISKSFALILILILNISSLSLLIIKPASAAGISISFGPSPFQTTYVNQSVNITVTPESGTPPYTYQWYTQLWTKIWGSPVGTNTPFPNATSSTFHFIEPIAGTYGISLQINDSAGNGDYDSFPVTGVWVVVQPSLLSSNTPSPTPKVSPYTSPTPAPTVPESPAITFLPFLSSVLVLVFCFKLRKKLIDGMT